MKTIIVKLPEKIAEEKAGEYKLQRLRGGERWDLDEECTEYEVDSMSGAVTSKRDFKKWTLKLLVSCCVEPKLTEEEFLDFPGPALDLLLAEASELNYLSQEQRRFLRNGSSSKSPRERL